MICRPSAASSTVCRTRRSGRATTRTQRARIGSRARTSASRRRRRRTPPAAAPTAGLRAERDANDARGDGGRRSAGRSARHAVRRERIARRTERAVLGGRAHRELVHVRLGDDDRAGVAQPCDRRRLVRAHVALENLRAARRRQRCRGDIVLDDDRHAVQRTATAPSRRSSARALRDAPAVRPDITECSSRPGRRTTSRAAGEARRRPRRVAALTTRRRPASSCVDKPRNEKEAVAHSRREVVARRAER